MKRIYINTIVIAANIILHGTSAMGYTQKSLFQSWKVNTEIKTQMARGCGQFNENNLISLMTNKKKVEKLKKECIDELAEKDPLFFHTNCNAILKSGQLYYNHLASSFTGELMTKNYWNGFYEITNHCYSKVNSIVINRFKPGRRKSNLELIQNEQLEIIEWMNKSSLSLRQMDSILTSFNNIQTGIVIPASGRIKEYSLQKANEATANENENEEDKKPNNESFQIF